MPVPGFPGTADTAIPRAPTESEQLARRFPSYPDRFTFEPSSRWVRGVVGDLAVVDSRHQILVWEPRAKVPEYAFPLEHVRIDLLQPAGARPPSADRYWRPTSPEVQWFDLVAGRRIPAAAWKWNVPGLDGYIAVSWYPGVLDGWFEEDEPVATHPRDPGNRVDAIASSRRVEVSCAGHRLAASDRPTLLFEHGLPTRFYIPPEDVDFTRLEPVKITNTCPYKGRSDRYWKLRGGDEEIAWCYSAPFLDSRDTWA